MIVVVDTGYLGHIAYTYSNGTRLSMTFGFGSYTENHHRMDLMPSRMMEQYESAKPVVSSTVEVMAFNNDALEEFIKVKYDQHPAGHVPVGEIPMLLQVAERLDDEIK